MLVERGEDASRRQNPLPPLTSSKIPQQIIAAYVATIKDKSVMLTNDRVLVCQGTGSPRAGVPEHIQAHAHAQMMQFNAVRKAPTPDNELTTLISPAYHDVLIRHIETPAAQTTSHAPSTATGGGGGGGGGGREAPEQGTSRRDLAVAPSGALQVDAVAAESVRRRYHTAALAMTQLDRQMMVCVCCSVLQCVVVFCGRVGGKALPYCSFGHDFT